jgi:FkbM family methyltransferase
MSSTKAGEHLVANAGTTTVWQICRGNDLYKFAMLLDPLDSYEKVIFEYHEAHQLYEPEVSALMIQVLSQGDIVVDVGANCGFFTVLAGTLVGPNGHVVAIEPAPANIAKLRKNLESNKLANVSVIDGVAAAQSGSMNLHVNSDTGAGHALWDPGQFPANEKSRANPKTISVAATTIDAECHQRSLSTPKLIKIDTEGAEQRVLEGAFGLLSGCKVPFVIVELHEFGLAKLGCTQQSLRKFMEDLGYSTFGLYNSCSLPKLVPPGTQIKSSVFVNILFSTPSNIAEYWPTTVIDPRDSV